MQKNPTRDELLHFITEAVTGPEFSRATFAGATRGAATEWVRVVVRPVGLRAEGHVRASMRAKFTQINEFLKQLRHALDDTDLRKLGRPVEILDCGCGSSYLTLAAHHYLNDVLGVPARILGVDVDDEVIRKSIERAGKIGAAGLSFACGRIGAVGARADIVVALHACDTATDDALAQAVRSE